MPDVIEHDFGAEKRLAARRLRGLLDLDALHEVNIRENPLPYIERANERIFQLEAALFDARLALSAPDDPATAGETVDVSRNDYRRLLRCAAIVEEAFATLSESADDE